MACNFPNIANEGSVYNTTSSPYASAATRVVETATTFMGKVTQVFKGAALAGAAAPAHYGQLPSAAPAAPIEDKIVTREVKLETVTELKKVDNSSKEMARYVLANPSPEAKNVCKKFYNGLSQKVKQYDLNHQDLNFITECTPDARGTYSWKHNQDETQRLDKLKNFTDKVKNNPSCFCEEDYTADVTNMEHIATSIGYRGIGPSWVENTTTPSENVTKMIKDMRKEGHLIEPIGKRQFANRAIDDLNNNPIKKSGVFIPQGEQDEMKGGLPGPQKGLSERSFAKDSYVAEAINEGISMRAHVSGSAPLSLGAAEFVMNEGKKEKVMDEKDIMNFGGILGATFELGDYHTLAETSAGVTHFMQEKTKTKLTDTRTPTLDKIPARNYLAMSVGHMNNLVSSKALPEYNKKVQNLFENVETAKQERTNKLQARKAAKARAKANANELEKSKASS